jgi:dihydropteroate synthase
MMTPLEFHCRDRVIRFDGRTRIMGILNVTPDSFSDGGEHAAVDAAVAHGLRLAGAGADILDVGGESTRPGAAPVAPEEECRRVVPVIAALRRRTDLPISVDTSKAPVAEAALKAGAEIINDVSAFRRDPALAAVAGKYRAGCILMHMRGVPATMQEHTEYANLIEDIRRSLAEALAAAAAGSGLPLAHFMLDPGIGFAKKIPDNPALIAAIPRFRSLGRPVLMGPSRKAFIGALTGRKNPRERDWGTAGAVAACALRGADVVRVHNVGPMRDALAVADAVRRAMTAPDA